MGEQYTSARRRLIGSVVSNRMDKTVVFSVERVLRHPLYGKVLRRRKKYKAHDEHNACKVGDVVRIVESRPLSREKRWVVEAIVESTEPQDVAEVGI